MRRPFRRGKRKHAGSVGSADAQPYLRRQEAEREAYAGQREAIRRLW